MSATDPQVNYLEILFADLGFDRRARNAWLSERVDREIRFLDQITVGEASASIEDLREMKEEKL